MNEIVSLLSGLISEVGFPIAIVIYFIWDRINTVKPMIKAINSQNTILNKILVKLDCYDLAESEEDIIE